MRQILRIGEGYALSKIYFSLLAVATIMCLYAVKQVSAQEAEPAATAVANAKPLQIGDTIPEYLWHLPLRVVNHPRVGGKDTITLNEYRDKLIILDFWATWCKPCISSLYKLDTLQKQFADKLVVIPTTYEAREKAGAFIANKGWSLPSAVGDTILKKYFPHQSIPHQVWIKAGRVEAIVGPEYAHANIIRAVLAGKHVAFNHKIEVPFDKTRPLFLGGNGGDGANMLYQSVISGRLSAQVAGTSRPTRTQVLAYNQTVEQLFGTAFTVRDLPQFSLLTIAKYFRFEIPDSLRYRISPGIILAKGSQAEFDRWVNSNLYCYNLVLPHGFSAADLGGKMLDDLNLFFGHHLNLKVRYETRKLRTLALIRTDQRKEIRTKGGEAKRKWSIRNKSLELTNQSIGYLVHYLNVAYSYPSLGGQVPGHPIVDETNTGTNVDLALHADLKDINAVRKELQRYGLDLVEKEADVAMIVFSNKSE